MAWTGGRRCCGAPLDRGYGGDGAPAAIVIQEARASDALARLRTGLKRQRRRSPQEVQRWAALHVVLHQTIARAAAARNDDVTVHVAQELVAAWSALRDGGLEVPVGNARVMTWYREVVRDILAPLAPG
jgi:hypothetical protein